MMFRYCILLFLSCAYLLNLVQCKPSDTAIAPTVNDENRVQGKNLDSWKAFISYRRAYSKHLARLTKLLLSAENVTAFMDVEDLEAGYWDAQLIEAIQDSPNFIILLSNGTLDRCIGDTNYTDPLHQEIKAAIDSNRNVVPVFDDYTHPKADFSPEIDEMMRFQGVEWNHSLVNATIHRLIRYLKDNLTPTNLKQDQ